MSALTAALWLVNIFLDASGQLSFKAAALEKDSYGTVDHWTHMARRPWIWLGVACYLAEFVFWIAFISLIPLSLGVLLSCVNVAVVMVAGRLLFDETLTSTRMVGIGLVAMGVAIVGLS